MEEIETVPLSVSAGGGGFSSWLQRRLPALRWARAYDRTSAAADAVAGVTLGLTLVPQSIAYASLANLPVQYGLYSAFVGTMLYVLLGTVKEVSIGPTSLMALLTLQACRDLPIDFVVLLTFLSGCIVLLMGLLRLDFLVDLISPSVTSGFTSATAIIIVVAQLKGLLGLSFVAESPAENLWQIAMRWRDVRAADCALAFVCCTTLLLLRKLKDVPLSPKRFKLKKTLWFISIGRNALVVFTASAFAFYTYDAKMPLFKLSGKVEPGLPKFGLPPFSTIVGNRTLGFLEMTTQLGSSLLLLPFVMVLANIAIAKAFSTGGRVDAAQEMLTLGVCNCVGALVRAMPTCGAFTRSAVSHSSGVRTPAAGLYSGIITLLALNYLTKYFFFIPKACLSSVLICAVIFMVDVGTARRLWRERRREALVAALTCGVGVCAGVEAAVLCGALASLAALLADLLRRPTLLMAIDKTVGGSVLLVRPRRALVYINAERFAARVRRAIDETDSQRELFVDCSALTLLDYTAVQVLGRLIKELESEGRQVVFFRASEEAARWLRRVPGLRADTLRERTLRDALRHSAVPATADGDAAALLDKDELLHEDV
ncbi:sodium-independent sulfate anion transporter-like isoform X1 [Vanessa atalanta]|uniref:sodium-independent sulfate anion transporter-like isoform X1 n=1 Tax=Vanessa atalanta TaxID=42275 RepID=UPI001FCCD7E0|nr:sodium-independent sulfate anion transporter-like isoform X1 [Vanessa atalanta]